MSDIKNFTASPTASAIFASYEAKRGQPRPHLGGSQIGHYCDRYLWYHFRWAEYPKFDGRMLRLFDHGNWEEKRIINDLLSIGAAVYSVDPDTGRQINYQAFGGHFGLSLDGMGKGFPEAPEKWHVLEFKTHSDKSFKTLVKNGVEKDKPQHYTQMQIGTHLSGIDRAMYIAVNKNTDELHIERIRHSKADGKKLLSRAERIIFSETPLERVSDRPDWYQCKFCEMSSVCHDGKAAEVNCRTCLHSTPERDGSWSCARHNKILSVKDQREGCNQHLFIPSLIGWAGGPINAGDDWVEYDGWKNHVHGSAGGRHCYTSKEVRASDKLPPPDEIEDVRIEFDGHVTECKHND